MDIWTLRLALISWKIDVIRHCSYHQENFLNETELNYANEIKQASFFIYWIIKTKPIVLGASKKDAIYNTLNQIFAFYVALHMLKIDPEEVPKEIMDKFIYLFYFRDVNPKHLFLTLELLSIFCKRT